MPNRDLPFDEPFRRLQADWRADTNEWLDHVVVGRSDHLHYLRDVYASGRRVAHIGGDFGAGKTTLMRMFMAQYADLFPSGTAYLYAEDLFDPKLDVAGLLPEISRGPGLLAVDELERSQRDPVSKISQVLDAHPQLRVLTASRRPSDLGISGDELIYVGGLTDVEAHEFLVRRLVLFDRVRAGELLDSLIAQPALWLAARESPRQLLAVMQRLLAKDFQKPGLFGPDGHPLSTGSAGYLQVVDDLSQVNDIVLQHLRRNPQLLHTLPPRRFEEVVAELLHRLGYDVSLTALSRDGGFDMYAARKDTIGTFLYLVECKRYVPPHKVGVEVVRALHGTVADTGATAGILVTTSFFTAGAEAFQNRTKYRVQLHDYLGVQRWLSLAH